jgi:hypothetical protein
VELTGVELSALPDEVAVGPDSPVILTVVLKNTSASRTFFFFQTTPERDFRLVARDSKGHTVPLTARGQMMARPIDSLMRVGRNIKPGEELRYKILASRLCDFSLSGTYFLTVTQHLSEFANGEKIRDGFAFSKPAQVQVGERFSPRLASGLYAPGPLKPDAVEQVPLPGAMAASRPTSLWKEGDTWPLRIELLTTEPPGTAAATVSPGRTAGDGAGDGVKVEPRLVARYGMRVKVAGTEHTDDGDYWQLDFTPEGEAPGETRAQSYRVLVSKKDGSMAAIIGLRGLGNPGLERGSGLTFTHEAPFGYPLLMFPLEQKREATSILGSRFSLATRTAGRLRVLEANSQRQQAKGFRLRQVWSIGAEWWDEYEMQDSDRQWILRAKKG